MDTDVALAILKVASVLIGATLGVAGLLANYRDKYGRLTRAGMAVLTGMGLSATVGVVTTSIESYKAHSQSAEQAVRTEAVLRELSRSILPIRQLQMTYWLEVPPGTDGAANYIKRLASGISERLVELEQLGAESERIRGLQASAIGLNREVITVNITNASDLWPTRDEIPLFHPPDVFVLGMDIFGKPRVPTEYIPVDGRSDFGALSLKPKFLTLQWDIPRKRLSIFAVSEFDKAFWRTNGKIASVVDIRGSQIMIYPPTPSFRRDDGEMRPNPDEARLIDALELRTLKLDFGDGHGVWVPGRNIKKTSTATGGRVFSIVFPGRESDFAAFTKTTGDD